MNWRTIVQPQEPVLRVSPAEHYDQAASLIATVSSDGMATALDPAAVQVAYLGAMAQSLQGLLKCRMEA